MDNGIKSYSLDCGCFFEHSKKAGCSSFELAIVCAVHKAEGTWANKLSSSSPPGLPPNPFLTKPQAGGPSREHQECPGCDDPMCHKYTGKITQRVTTGQALSGLKAMMELEGPGLGKAELMAKAQAEMYEQIARAKGWDNAEDVEDGRLVVFNEELRVHVYSWREAAEYSEQPMELPQVLTNTKYEADVQAVVDAAFHFQKSPFATALERGAVLDELEHTQPIPAPYTMQDARNDIESVMDRVQQIEDKLEGLENRLPRVER